MILMSNPPPLNLNYNIRCLRSQINFKESFRHSHPTSMQTLEFSSYLFVTTCIEYNLSNSLTLSTYYSFEEITSCQCDINGIILIVEVLCYFVCKVF